MSEPAVPADKENSERRFYALSVWVEQQLAQRLPTLSAADCQLQSLDSDAGFRRYFRLQMKATHDQFPLKLLAVDAPPATEDSAQFVALAQYLREHGIRTPAIFAVDAAQGFLLIEDFGDALLQGELQRDSATSLYGEAFMALLALQQCPDNPLLIPRYDQAMLRRELEIFRKWFVEKLLAYSLTDAEHILLNNLFGALEAAALEQPQVLVHRDFHSRNLLVCESGALGVIDFQGALWGPFTYDPVSLLRDCYLRWPEEDVQRWALAYGNMAMDAGIAPEVDTGTYLRWFDWMGLQRHIKVLGIFARLHLRDHKSHYLDDLTRVIGYVLEISERYPALQDFARWFRAGLLPIAAHQSWYREADIERISIERAGKL